MFLTPRPAGRLLRRRAGLRRAPAATRTPVRRCSRARSPSTRTSRSSRASTLGSVDRFDTDAPLYQHIAALAAAARGPPGPRERRADRALRRRRRRRLRVQPRRPRREDRVPRRDEQRDDRQDGLRPDADAGCRVHPALRRRAGVHHRRGRRRIRHRARPVVRGVHAPTARSPRPPRPRRSSIAAPAAGAALTGLAPRESPTSPTRGQRRASRGASSATTSGRRSGPPKTPTPRVFHDVAALAAARLSSTARCRRMPPAPRPRHPRTPPWATRVTTVPDEPEEPESPVEPEPQEADRVRRTSAFRAASTARPAAPATGSPTATNVQMEKVDGIWTPDARRTSRPASYMFKIATEKNWDENYGAGGVQNGGDIPLTHAAGRSRSTSTRAPRTSARPPTARSSRLPGSFQSELGCAGDWAPVVPGRDDVRPQRRRRLPVHDRRPAHRLVRGQGDPRPQLGRELRRRRRAGRRRTSPSPPAPARSSPSCTTSRRTSSRCRPATRPSRARASCARTGSTPTRSPGRPTWARPPRMPRGSSTPRPTPRSPSADGEVTGGDPIDLTRDRRRADRRAEGSASRRSPAYIALRVDGVARMPPPS